jgi:hypothetical protein
MFLSGKESILYIYARWPMDGYATVTALILLFFLCLSRMSKKKPETWGVWKEKISRTVAKCLLFFVQAVSFYWLKIIIHGLFFTFNEKKGAIEFDPYRTMYILAGFITLFRLGVGGREIHDLRIGPDVDPPKHVLIKKYEARPYVSVKKVIFAPLGFYDLIALLIFVGMFFTRRDIEAGDKRGLLEKFLDLVSQYQSAKHFGSSSGLYPLPPSLDTTTTTDKNMSANAFQIEENKAVGDPVQIEKPPSRMQSIKKE